MIENSQPVTIVFFFVQISFLGAQKSSALWHDPALRQSIEAHCSNGHLVAVITSWA